MFYPSQSAERPAYFETRQWKQCRPGTGGWGDYLGTAKYDERSYKTLPEMQRVNHLASQLSATSLKFAKPVIFYARASTEFAAQVAKNQNLLSPGSWAHALQGYSSFVSMASNGQWRNVTISQFNQLALASVQVAGFFFVGEMIGRRSIVGYKVKDPSHNSHH